MTVHWQPKGYPNAIPCLTVKDASGLLGFIEAVFGGTVFDRHEDGGVVRHGEIRVGDSIIMVAEASEQWPAERSSLYVYLPDADATYRTALEHGATPVMEVGDRCGGVKDAWGNTWWIATHVEDPSPQEIQRRAQAKQ